MPFDAKKAFQQEVGKMLIQRSMGRANQVLDRNVKAWLSEHKSISLP